MATKSFSTITISSLRGGVNDNDPPTSLAADACTVAENVEFFQSTLGERRLGCLAINLPTSITADDDIEAVTWMGRHLPTNFLGDAELWALGQNLTSSDYVLARRTQTAWSSIIPNDAIDVTAGQGSMMNSESLHGKLYIMYKSSVDQAHVWDGTSFRKTGLAAPAAAPTGANTGSGSLAASARYYRVRYVKLSGSTILLRGEPSAVLTFTPSGSGTGVIVTKPAAINQGETHWELEASTDNANFYMIARTLTSTTTVTDSQAYASGFAPLGPLSEELTAYTLIPSGKFLTVDSDRLIIAGSWETPAYASRIWWTPVLGSEGVGNDERLDMNVNPFIDLDGFDGGEITGISKAINGYLYAFKWSRIYKIIRRGQLTSAYDAVPLTTSRGAIPHTVVEAPDQSGNPAIYFLDPCVGPMRIGNYGLEWCGRDIRKLWRRVNQNALIPAHGVFYQTKNQVHYWVALDGADYPNAKIIVHCSEMVSGSEGARRGWVTVPVGNRIADAYCSLPFSSNIDSTDMRDCELLPFIGKKQWSVSGSTIKDLIQRCDVGNTDAFTTGDTQAYYYASVKTRPFSPFSTLTQYRVMAATLLTIGINGATTNVYIKAIRDFGVEEFILPVNLVPNGNEEILIKKLDNLSWSELTTIQLELGDLNLNIIPDASWQLHMLTLKLSEGQTS